MPFPLHQVGSLSLTEYNKLSRNERALTSPGQAHDVGHGRLGMGKKSILFEV